MAAKPSASIMSGLNRLKSSTASPSSTSTSSSSSSSMSMLPMPFQFPFSPFSFGLNLFDNANSHHGDGRNAQFDPNRILHILHQQSLLAEELLKYRALLGMPSTSTSTHHSSSSSSSKSYMEPKPSIELFKIPSDTKTKDSVHESEMNAIPSNNNNNNKRQTPSSSTSEIDLTKDDGCPTPKIKARPESDLLPDKMTTMTTISPAAVSAMLIDPDELKCHICMANFPSLWLLEQHTALQHSQLSCSEKPTKCENCGQNYRLVLIINYCN